MLISVNLVEAFCCFLKMSRVLTIRIFETIHTLQEDESQKYFGRVLECCKVAFLYLMADVKLAVNYGSFSQWPHIFTDLSVTPCQASLGIFMSVQVVSFEQFHSWRFQVTSLFGKADPVKCDSVTGKLRCHALLTHSTLIWSISIFKENFGNWFM